MAQLTAGQKVDIGLQLMRKYSTEFREIPVTKNGVFNFITKVDQELEQSEMDIFTSLPPGDAKTWLQNNPEVGRDIMILVEQARRENI